MQRRHARQLMVENWVTRLTEARSGLRTVGAIRLVLPNLVNRQHGGLSFRLVITGHSCFGTYLHCIGWEATAECHFCRDAEDSAQHTLEFCSAWAEQYRVLGDIMEGGGETSPYRLVNAIVGGKEAWNA